MTLQSRAQDLDVASLSRVLRAALLPVLLAALALATLAFLYSRHRPAVYSASTSLAALPTSTGNAVINNSLVSAPTLPAGVVSRALYSPAVVQDALKRLDTAVAASPERSRVEQALQTELHTGNFRTVTLSADIDQNLIGSYTIAAQARTPEIAKATADAFAQALLRWDRDRALEGVNRARANLMNQRDLLSGQVVAGGKAVSDSTLTQMKSNVTQSLQQIEMLRQTITGTLSLISEAVVPVKPISPKPLRDALLTFGFTLFFGLLLAMLRDRLGQQVRDEQSLRRFAIPMLGLLPPVPARRLEGSDIRAFMQVGGFREQMEFVRVGLISTLEQVQAGQSLRETENTTAIIALSSSEAKEGKSTTTAGLAYVCAQRGMKVLVVDADIYRHRQQQLLNVRQVSAEPGSHDPHEMLTGVQDNMDLLVVRGNRLEPTRLSRLVRTLSLNYDIVLVDTPPALKVADTLAFARLIDGLLLVVDVQTPLRQIERLVIETLRVGINPMGFVLNRYREARTTSVYNFEESTLPAASHTSSRGEAVR